MALRWVSHCAQLWPIFLSASRKKNYFEITDKQLHYVFYVHEKFAAFTTRSESRRFFSFSQQFTSCIKIYF